MWGTGADTMRCLAAPMIGGLATSFVMELLVYPVIFYQAKRVALRGSAPRRAAMQVRGTWRGRKADRRDRSGRLVLAGPDGAVACALHASD